LFSLLVCARIAQTVELAAHWTFDGHLLDQVSGYDGTVNGGNDLVLYDSDGKFGGYAEFNASQIHLDGEAFDWSADESFSLSLWMRDAQSSHAVIIGRDDGTDAPGSDVHWWLGTWADGTPALWLLDNNRQGPEGLTYPVNLCDNEWHQLVAVHNAEQGMLHLYVDGRPQDSTTFAYENNFNSESPVTLGYMQLGGGYSYSGDLDDLRLYKGALEGDEVLDIYSSNTRVSSSGVARPTTPLLLSNYPNPFNPTTTIDYSIQHPGMVQLNVYDLMGQDVATLVNEQKPAGTYQVHFDAQDLPSGVYIYTLKSAHSVQSHKMVLMK
jgi:hypothetical protein